MWPDLDGTILPYIYRISQLRCSKMLRYAVFMMVVWLVPSFPSYSDVVWSLRNTVTQNQLIMKQGMLWLAYPLIKVLMGSLMISQSGIIIESRYRPIIIYRLYHRDELEISALIAKWTAKLTLLPHLPKSCTLPSPHFSSFIPSTTGISIASYSSVTIGKKKTNRPPGTSRYLASRIRSNVRWDSS